MFTLLENFEGYSQILKEQSGKKSFNTSNSNNLKIWKSPYLKKKIGIRVVVDFMDTRFSNFAIKYLRENKKFRKTIFSCSYGAHVESLKTKQNGRKSCDTAPLKEYCL